MYKFKGTVVEVGDIQTFASGFTKRDIVCEEVREKPSKYPNPVKFSFKKDDCSLLDGVKKGQTVTICFNVNGRKWDGPKGTQYFVDLAAFKIDVEGSSKESVPEPATPQESDYPEEDPTDMPF